jgi:hypothetical protein
VILFAYDMDEYLADRGMYITLDQLPFPIVTTTDELCSIIADGSYQEMGDAHEAFAERFLKYDSADNAKHVLDILLEKPVDDVPMIDYSSKERQPLTIVNARPQKTVKNLRGILETADPEQEVVLLQRKGFGPVKSGVVYDDYLDFNKVYEALIWDTPELFYIQHLYDVYRADGTYTIGDEGQPVYTDGEIAEINQRLEEILHRFDGIEDEFELELAVHDFITESYDFEEQYPFEEQKNHPEWAQDMRYHDIFTVAGAVKTGKAVCGGLIRMAQLILQRKGMEVANIVSDFVEDGEKGIHSWLAVKIEGEWYHLDLTVNECETQDKDYPQYTHFNVTDEEISVDHVLVPELYPGITCTATSANYYVKKGLYFTMPEQIENAFYEYMKDKIAWEKTHYYYFRTPKEMDNMSAYKALARGVRRLGVSFAWEKFGCADSDGYFAIEINPPRESE